jgi:hypothetical protein
MQTVSTIGLDIAKSLFQVHGGDDFMGVPRCSTPCFTAYEPQTVPERSPASGTLSI